MKKVVLIDFMFMACPGCVKIVPYLANVEQLFSKRDDVAFIAISEDMTTKSEFLFKSFYFAFGLLVAE